MSIGEQIKKYRKAAGLKQVELEEHSGVAGGTISAMEKRGSLTSHFLPQLAGAFGLTVDQLIDEITDYSEHVRAFVAREREHRHNPGRATLAVQDNAAKPWARPSGGYWPFSVSLQRVMAALLPEDLSRASAYLLALVETRELEALHAGAKNNGTNGPAQR